MARAGVPHKTKRQLGASSPVNVANDCVEAVRQGCYAIGIVNDKTGIGANTILTDATLIYNVGRGQRVMVNSIAYGLLTVSDSMHIELGFTSAANGAGSFTPITAHREVVTGAAIAGFTMNHEVWCPARVVSYAEGARSITFRVTANDTNAEVTLEWSGWIEKE